MAKSSYLMTEGTVWKRIIRFAVPLFIGQLFQQLYNTVDSLIVGRLIGTSALAAVTATGSIIFLIVFIIAETISYYFSISKKDSSKKEKYRRVSSGGFTAFSVLSDDLNVP